MKIDWHQIRKTMGNSVFLDRILLVYMGIMPTINTAASHHAGPPPNSGWQWLPFPAHHLHVLNQAIHTISSKIQGSHTCSTAFQALPGGRTFAAVWTDASIWTSFDPGIQAQRFGATLGKEVALSAYTLKMGHWTVAATLIHELAHVNGAPGGLSHAAEATLKQCLLGKLEDPTIMGMFHSAGSVKLA